MCIRDSLRDFFKDSEFSDGAPVGLGDIAFEKGEYDKALELFRDALNNYPGSSHVLDATQGCLLYTSPSPRDRTRSRMPSSAWKKKEKKKK